MTSGALDSAKSKTAPTAASDWVESHGDYLFNFAIGQVRDSDVAQDLVQETFLGALKARDRFAGESSERTWLTGILRHKIYDHLRRTCRERRFRFEPSLEKNGDGTWDDAVLWLHDLAAECESPSRRMELAEIRENLELALGRLPPRLAQVFQLYSVEQRSNREVCEILNLSEGNLWVMLHRARTQLREHLRSWWHWDDRDSHDTASVR